MPGHPLHQKKKYWSINIKMTAEPLVYNQKEHTAAEREEVGLHSCICLDKKTFSGFFISPFLPCRLCPVITLLTARVQTGISPNPINSPEQAWEHNITQGEDPPHLFQEPHTPLTHALILIVQPLEMRGRTAWWEPLDFTGICFKSSLGNNCLVDWKLIAMLKRMIQFLRVTVVREWTKCSAGSLLLHWCPLHQTQYLSLRSSAK